MNPEVLAGPQTELFPIRKKINGRGCCLKLGSAAVAGDKAAARFCWFGVGRRLQAVCSSRIWLMTMDLPLVPTMLPVNHPVRRRLISDYVSSWRTSRNFSSVSWSHFLI